MALAQTNGHATLILLVQIRFKLLLLPKNVFLIALMAFSQGRINVALVMIQTATNAKLMEPTSFVGNVRMAIIWISIHTLAYLHVHLSPNQF